jgi:hypothetical protein
MTLLRRLLEWPRFCQFRASCQAAAARFLDRLLDRFGFDSGPSSRQHSPGGWQAETTTSESSDDNKQAEARRSTSPMRPKELHPDESPAAQLLRDTNEVETVKAAKVIPQGAVFEPDTSILAGSIVLPRGRGSTIRITVGFDFGTHSTKVLWRKHGTSISHILRLDSPCQGFPAFASPSLVRLDNDHRLWFGSHALGRNDGYLYQSLKVRLLGPDHERVLKPLPPGPTPQVLVAAYLAWAFQTIRDTLRSEFGAHQLRMNLAAPMNHVQHDALRDSYLGIVQTAWSLVFGDHPIELKQGCSLAELEPRLKTRLDSPLVDQAERHFEILPETVAPIVSMSFNPQMAPGVYIVVDMGGSTTEISVNDVDKSQDGHRVRCYRDNLLHIGGMHFAASLASEEGRARLLRDTKRAMHKVWAEGYDQNKDGPRSVRESWKSLRVLLAGGGTLQQCVKDMIDNSSPLLVHFRADKCPYEVTRYKPSQIDLGCFNGSASIDLSFLGVAHGLAWEAQRWPELFKPKELTAYDRPEPREMPEPYWYVGGK